MLHKHHRKRVHVRLFGKPPRARHLGRDVGVGADAPPATRRLHMGQRGIEVDKRDPATLASKMARGDVAMDEPRMKLCQCRKRLYAELAVAPRGNRVIDALYPLHESKLRVPTVWWEQLDSNQ